MKSKNDVLYENAERAIRDLVNDNTVSTQTTRVNLETLQELIDHYLNGLPDDVEVDEEDY